MFWFQLGTCDQDSRLLEDELAEMQQTEEENQFAVSQERHRCVLVQSAFENAVMHSVSL